MATKQPITVELGQPVMVVTGYRAPARPGEVAKVGRVWVEITIEAGKNWSQTARFRLDDQTDGSKVGSPAQFYTLEQWAEHRRRAEAAKFLNDQGITIGFTSPWRGRAAELADIIRAGLAAAGEG